ncbi:(2Fe-2S) ferredoxin domain-containing protein [Paenibacillus sp. TRM 82003]|nr:(2Fe-2S) ferredoxin domain-containing protein [Paenibacillus sp. TRM 82003]
MDRDLSATQHHILICNGGSCMHRGAEEVTLQLRDEIARLRLDASIHTSRTRCNGRCGDACVVIVYPEGTWYRDVTPDVGRAIVGSLRRGESHAPAISYQYNGETFVSRKDPER